jgi:hypothetical protein
MDPNETTSNNCGPLHLLPLTSRVPEVVLTKRGNYFLLITVSRNRGEGGMVLSEPEEEMVISERNDGGLIYVAETRNQPLSFSHYSSPSGPREGAPQTL